MDKRRLKRRKMLFIGATTYVAACMTILYVRSRLRNRGDRITYSHIKERDMIRIDYLNNKFWKNETTCTNTIMLKRTPFFRLCEVLRERFLLRDTIHVCAEKQVAMFLNTIGHNLRNRLVGSNFTRSCETVGRYFGCVKVARNPRWDPFFKDCIGAIDDTHIRASVSKPMELAFRGRKLFPTQNVMATVDFDLRFTYVLAGWEGTAHDATVLADAIERENVLCVPKGKFYLVDAGYGAKPGFIPPFRGVRYHLNERGNNHSLNENELFNLRHSSLRVSMEHAFGSLKRRFKVLDDATPFFPFSTQIDVVIASCILHNWVLSQGSDHFVLPETSWTPNPRRTAREQTIDHRAIVDQRQTLVNEMWEACQNYQNH